MRKLLSIVFLFAFIQSTIAPTIPEDWVRRTNNEFIYRITDEGFYTCPFSVEKLYEAIIFVGIQNPEIVLRQCIIETGWFKSKAFIMGQNPFGMHFAESRETNAVGWEWGDFYDGQYHQVSIYKTWYDAVKDYKLWQDFWLKGEILDNDQYYLFLNDGSYSYLQSLATLYYLIPQVPCQSEFSPILYIRAY